MLNTTPLTHSGQSFLVYSVLHWAYILWLKKYLPFQKKNNLKKRLTFVSYLLSMLAIHGAFAILALLEIFKISSSHLLLAQLSSFFIILVSAAILFLKNTGDQSAFTFRLLILMTTQMLGYLSILLAFIYTNQATQFVLYMLGLALSVLVIQTSYLVRRLKWV